MLGIAWLLSSYRKRVDWRLVGFGLILQLVFAGLFFNSQNWKFRRSFKSLEQVLSACESGSLEPPAVDRYWTATSENSFSELWSQFEQESLSRQELEENLKDFPADGLSIPRFENGVVFYVIESFFAVIQKSVDNGAAFLFETHPGPDDEPPTHPKAVLTTFAFGVLPTVIFFAALMSVLYYLGIMQLVVRGLGWIMEKTLHTSPAESLAAAANVLLGHTEAPLVVKPYVPTMTRSELNALMVGGFSTISGSLMAIFASMNVSAGHLLTASIISAPAALVIAKILQPETEDVVALEVAEQQQLERPSNVLEAAASGASEGMKLALNIGAMLIAFLALIMFIDILLQGFFGWFGLDVSLSVIFGALFYPLAWIMGIATNECWVAGDLLGKKMVVNEFLAFIELSAVPDIAADIESGISDRTRTILTYALCGFSNFGAIGIQLGGIGPLAPDRRGEMAQLGLRAMFGGMLAACMTASIAGVFYGWLGN